jgi:hypothetical protein
MMFNLENNTKPTGAITQETHITMVLSPTLLSVKLPHTRSPRMTFNSVNNTKPIGAITVETPTTMDHSLISPSERHHHTKSLRTTETNRVLMLNDIIPYLRKPSRPFYNISLLFEIGFNF